MNTDGLGNKYTALFEEWRIADSAACVAQHDWRIAAQKAANLKGIYEQQRRVVDDLTATIKETMQEDLQELAALNGKEIKP